MIRLAFSELQISYMFARGGRASAAGTGRSFGAVSPRHFLVLGVGQVSVAFNEQVGKDTDEDENEACQPKSG